MQERLKLLISDDLEKLQNKVILIIGLGGVGSYSLETLARCYFKKIIIVDGDTIDISNLNRQLMTDLDNVGLYKTDVFEKRIKTYNPDCEIVKITKFITPLDMELLFKDKVDYVIDACDTIDCKIAIINYCLKNKIKFISSMGMANRIDASKVCISTLDKTSCDPLARKLRLLFKDKGKKIPVVYSLENYKRLEKLGSISYVPATAGLLCTSYIINDILKGD